MLTNAITTKLHILAGIILILMCIYMTYIYREMKMVELELQSMRGEVAALKATVAIPLPQPTAFSFDPSIPAIINLKPTQPAPVVTSVQQNVVKDDDASSVKSADINDLMTNIQQIDNDESDTCDEDDAPVPVHDAEKDKEEIEEEKVETNTIVQDENVDNGSKTVEPSEDNQDLAQLSLDELRRVGYDDMRAYLKMRGENSKGKKEELVQRIASLKNNI
jgi:hypothetical protein